MFDFYNYTYCIRCDNLDLIEQALTRSFELEGASRIPLPPPPSEIEELWRDPWLFGDQIWTIGLFVGAPGWTIIKALREEILCLRAIDAQRLRLAELAMHLGSDAFYLGTYNNCQVLLEVEAQGNIFVSGEDGSLRSEPGKFFDEPINLRDNERFCLLQMPQDLQKTERLIYEEDKQRYDEWQEQFLEDYAKCHFPLWTLSELEQAKARWKEMLGKPDRWLEFDQQEEWQQLYDEWQIEVLSWQLGESHAPLIESALDRLLGGPRSYWYVHNLLYMAYTQQEQLEADGARLLCFQPEEQLRQTTNEILQGKRSNRVLTDEDDIPF